MWRFVVLVHCLRQSGLISKRKQYEVEGHGAMHVEQLFNVLAPPGLHIAYLLPWDCLRECPITKGRANCAAGSALATRASQLMFFG